MSVETLQSHIRQNTDAIGVQTRNIANLQSDKPGNTIKVSEVASSSGVAALKLERVENQQLLESLLVGGSEAGYSSAIYDYNKQIVAKIGAPDSRNYLGTRFSDIISGLNVTDPSAAGAREAAVGKVTDFCHAVKTYTTDLEDIRKDLEEELSSTFNTINDKLRELASINGRIKGNDSDFELKDRRDQLLKELAPLISIKTSFAPNGIVSIRNAFAKDGIELVSNTRCAKFNYSESLQAIAPTKTIEVEYIAASGSQSTVMKLDLSKASMGGEIEGLLKVRDETLPQALKSINDTAAQIADQINKFHNLGSGYPPQSVLTSENTVASTDRAIYTGKVLIGVTDNTGKPMANLRPVNLDFDAMPKKSGTGIISVDEIATHINAEGACDTQIGVGLGSGVYNDVNICLIDQIALIPSDIDDTGAFSFEVRLRSGADVGTSFEILTATLDDGNPGAVGANAGTVNNFAGVFNLEAGATVTTGKNITATLPVAGAGNVCTIRMNMRVVGKDGTFETKQASFTIPNAAAAPLRGAQIFNSRIQGLPDATVGADLRAPATAAKVAGAGQVHAEIVDDKLVIRSMGVDTGVFIINESAKVSEIGADADDIPKGFSEHFGLRNLLNYDKENPARTIAVKDDILADNHNLALAIPTLVATTTQAVTNGLTKASARFTLARAAVNNDTVTINGIAFTFGGAPGNIAAGLTPDASLQNLLRAIQAHPSTMLNPLLDFAADPAAPGSMIVTAKFAGTHANAITVAAGGTLGPPNWIDIPLAGGGQAVETAFLAGGTNNPNVGVATVSRYTYEVGKNMVGVFANLSLPITMNIDGVVTMSLESYFSRFLSEVSTDADIAKQDKSVADKVVTKLQEAYKSAINSDKNEFLLDAVRRSTMINFLWRMIDIINKSQSGALTLGG